MIGSSIVSGSLPRARETLSRTSAAAESGSRFNEKRTLIRLFSDRLCEVMISTPSIPASESSSGLVTCDSTTSADAPRYLVDTLTTGSLMRGSSRTERRVYEIIPTSRMMSESTVAKTGRLMHISGSCMSGFGARRRADVRLGGTRRPRLRRILGCAALSGGGWRGLACGRARIGGIDARDLHRNAVAQLELPRGHDDVLGEQTLHDLGLRVAALSHLDLHALGLAIDDAKHVLVLALRHQRLALVARDEAHPRERARPQRGVGIAYHCAQHERPACRIDQRIHRIHLPGERAARLGVEGDLERLADTDLRIEHLRHAEVDLE